MHPYPSGKGAEETEALPPTSTPPASAPRLTSSSKKHGHMIQRFRFWDRGDEPVGSFWHLLGLLHESAGDNEGELECTTRD